MKKNDSISAKRHPMETKEIPIGDREILNGNKKERFSRFLSGKPLKAATYSPALHCSTIGDDGLNFSVRNGKRWDPAAVTT